MIVDGPHVGHEPTRPSNNSNTGELNVSVQTDHRDGVVRYIVGGGASFPSRSFGFSPSGFREALEYREAMVGSSRPALPMFGPIGNFEDYWLGTPTPRPEGEVWVGAEDFLRALRQQEDQEPNRDAVESLMGSDGERGGGLSGATDELRSVRNGIIAIGQASLDDAKRRARL